PTGWWDPVSQRRARDPVAQALPQRVPLGAWNRAAAQRGIVLAVSAFEYHVAAGRPRGHAHRRTPPQHRPGPGRPRPGPKEAYAHAEDSARSPAGQTVKLGRLEPRHSVVLVRRGVPVHLSINPIRVSN